MFKCDIPRARHLSPENVNLFPPLLKQKKKKKENKTWCSDSILLGVFILLRGVHVQWEMWICVHRFINCLCLRIRMFIQYLAVDCNLSRHASFGNACFRFGGERRSCAGIARSVAVTVNLKPYLLRRQKKAIFFKLQVFLAKIVIEIRHKFFFLFFIITCLILF